MRAIFGTKRNMLGKTIHSKPLLSPVLTVIFMLFVQTVFAQTSISVPYTFSFEEEENTELENWVFNPGVRTDTLKDQWVVGTAVHSEGRRAAYISCNKGVDANFDVTTNIQYLYRDFVLPAGQYDCTFDIRCIGAPEALISAGVAPATAIQTVGGPTFVYPTNLETYIPSSMKRVNNVSKWTNVSFQFSSNGSRTLRLFFIWQNANRDSTMSAIGACVDNIQITSRACGKPRSIYAESRNDSVIITWEGSSEEYVLEFRKYGRSKWQVTTGILGKQYILEGLEEGAYDFRVRGVCNGTDFSAYTYLNTFAVYYPENHCIDYVHLEDNPNVIATYGTYSNPYEQVGVVDFGPDDKLSRHTVNWEPDRTDPRTRGKLRVVPDGALASVRLGNWSLGAEAESVSYKYVVDAENAAILLVRYAVVLEDPQHDMKSQPRFTLEIFGEDGELISPTCGYADFYADASREGWHTEGSGYNQVTWKDWTTIGLNLEERDGEELTVRLTTYDCAWSGHYGYAYFTLDCAAARIVGTSCGDDAQMSISAPIGFDYEWFDKYDNPVPSSKLADSGMTLLVDASDTTTYRCHLSYKEEQSCGFDLYSSARPRFPIADFDYKYEPANCQNRVRFINKSHILTKYNNVEEHHYDQPCDEYEWTFGDVGQGSDRNPIFIFPNEGGTYRITLTALIAEGRCSDETEMVITIPAIKDKALVVDTAICEGSYVVFGRYYAGVDGVYTDSFKTVAGCDSIVSLHLKVNPVTNKYVGDTTVCAETPLVIDGQAYKGHESGKFYRFYTNAYGCDSTLWMNVTVMDSILPEVTTRVLEEKDAFGTIYVDGKGFDYYTVNGGEPTLADSLYDLAGGTYVLEFFNDFGCSAERTVQISTCLPGCVFQRWNNVLSLKDSAFVDNAVDYQFTDFQWYKEDVPIEGANKSYLYVEEGLEIGARYTLRMKRVSNGEEVETCSYIPKALEEMDKVVVYPSPVRVGQTLTVKSNKAGSAAFVSMIGETVQTNAFGQGTSSIPAPSLAGVYVVKVTIDGKIQTCRITVIE